MKTYKTSQKTWVSPMMCQELNAVVLMKTFESFDGEVKADLYKNPNSADCLVAYGTCAPIHGVLLETVNLII